MAANKFATMLHRNTNKISLILVYAVLEWILIVLLLLNSLFSYLIIKFAEYFGLKPPCLWCTRLDHIFDPAKKKKNMHRDLLCEAHSKEISKLGYCSNHQKLVESQEMCEDCLSSRPEVKGSSKNFAFFPWMKDLGMIQRDEEKVGENGEVSLNCSCCGLSLDSKNHNRYSSYILLKTPSWDVLECAHKENLIIEAGEYDDNHIEENCGKISDFATNLWDGEKVLEDKNESVLSGFDGGLEVTENEMMKELKGEEDEVVNVVFEMEEEKETLMEDNSTMIMIDKSVQVCVEKDSPVEISSQHLEFFLDYSGHRLVPIELVDSIEEHQRMENTNFEKHDKNEDQESGLDCKFWVEEKEGLVVDNVSRMAAVNAVLDVDINEEPKFSGFDSIEIEEDENSLVFHAKDFEQFTTFLVDKIPSEDASYIQELAGHEEERNSYVLTASEEVAQMVNNENEADISIGTEIPDLDIINEIQIQESIHLHESTYEDPSTSSAIRYEVEHHGPVQVEEQMVELKPLSIQERDHMMNNQQSFYTELYEIEEDKVPDTPTSVDSLNQLHKKLLLLEKKESGTEESLDGSVTSELEGSDGVVTVERLKSALRAERKTLQALYAELEEERSASAVAANQTMAMINRLQEEKAAMQMEALQYQRMMDEQSDYDQEALELLNELMVKREKEKLELEKELEVCRKKLLDYETKEKLRALKRSKDGSIRSGFSSASCSNGDDSDGLSIDLNQEAKEEEGFYRHQEYTPVDAAVNLEESLADFEEERYFILEQLKMLEEKLMTMEDDDHKEKHLEDLTEMEDFQEENGNHVDDETHFNTEANGHTNGFLMNGKHHQHRRIATQKGKSLLPLFDAISDENGDEISNGNANGIHSNGMHHSYESKFGIDSKNLAIEEEVDHLYQRLQAFEADREFLKHCINSLKKGDKGMDLLQEILQHLRDLRSVELRARSLSDNAII